MAWELCVPGCHHQWYVSLRNQQQCVHPKKTVGGGKEKEQEEEEINLEKRGDRIAQGTGPGRGGQFRGKKGGDRIA